MGSKYAAFVDVDGALSLFLLKDKMPAHGEASIQKGDEMFRYIPTHIHEYVQHFVSVSVLSICVFSFGSGLGFGYSCA